MNSTRRTNRRIALDIVFFVLSILCVTLVTAMVVGMLKVDVLPLLVFPVLLAVPALALVAYTGLDLITGDAARISHRWTSHI